MFRIRPRPSAAFIAASLAWAAVGLAQDQPKDDGLDKLLEKIEAKEGDRADKPSAEVSDKDQGLDDLLKKIGETEEKPTATGKAAPGPPGGDPGLAPKKDNLPAEERDLERELERIMGKKHKQDQRRDEEDSPLAETIKKMREVEKKLGEPDTGKDTQEKQKQIVSDLDALYKKARAAGGNARGKRLARMQGKQPGPGDGTTAGGSTSQAKRDPRQPPKRSEGKALAVDKDTWGHLGPEMRTEMNNISRELPLDRRAELIRRYYLSVGKMSLSRGE